MSSPYLTLPQLNYLTFPFILTLPDLNRPCPTLVECIYYAECIPHKCIVIVSTALNTRLLEADYYRKRYVP